MKIVLVSMEFDYGDEKRGLSLDHYYFAEPLLSMGIDVVKFDFMAISKIKGKDVMNVELLNLVSQEKPEITLVVPFTDQFYPETIKNIGLYSKSIVYYFDDVWRLEYSQYWSKYFSFATTSDVNGLKKWKMRGCDNFLYSPFGCNHNLFKRNNLSKKYDVSFVGGYHPYRAWVFKRLLNVGINIQAFGHGWPNGRLEYEEMVTVFNESKINLNLSNNESWDIRYIFSLSNGFKNSLHVIYKTIKSLINKDSKTKEMVKARHFEINSCGGFQLSYNVEGLEKHYILGNEIAIYESVEDLIEKIFYYLKYEDERTIIAQNGYERTINNHTMEKRFEDLFKTAGFLK